MQEFDKIWLDQMKKGGLMIELYMRYMDDGRKLLHPVRYGWRWVEGGMQYCMRWEDDDKLKTPLERTVHLLRSTVSGMIDYLEFTFETGEDYQDASEHLGAARKGDERSHMVRHQKMEHPGEPPAFVFKVVSSHRTALNRQIKEAVRIRRRGRAASILNSKSEFNRCQIPRLVVEVEDEKSRLKRLEDERLEEEELRGVLDREHSTWREKKARELHLQDTKRRRQSEGEEDTRPWGARRRPKKLKFATIEENWGEEGGDEDGVDNDQPVDQPNCDLNVGFSGEERRILSTSCKASLITDYYSPRARRMEHIV